MQNRRLLSDLIAPVRIHKVEKFLDMKSAASLNMTCKFFHHEVTQSRHWQEAKQQREWQAKILELGVSAELLNSVVQMGAIRDYENLHITLSKMPMFVGMLENTWELLMMSGESNAVQYAVKHELIKADTQNRWHENPLHLAVFSGKVSAVKVVMSVLPISPDSLTIANLNLYCMAAWRGSVEVINYLHLLHQRGQLKHTPHTTFPETLDAFEHARMYSPSVELQNALATPDQEMLASFKDQEEMEKVTMKLKSS